MSHGDRGGGFAYVCPTCEMTPGEHSYRLRILADSEAVYAEEARAYRVQRNRSAVA